jgi:cephalosporin-C deacetylase-like acetyl esterase
MLRSCSAWREPDDSPVHDGACRSVPRGFLTLGIEHHDDDYYHRVFTDGVRAVDAARVLPGMDPTRIVVAGASQGGGIPLTVAGLVPSLAAASWTSHSCVTSGAPPNSSRPTRTRKSRLTCGPTGIGWN